MTFDRTSDLELVRQILTAPACYAKMVNDSAPRREDFRPDPDAQIEYVLARDEGAPVGVFLLAGAEIHFCLLPMTWGDTERIARGFLAWVWANTKHGRLVGKVPSYNALARKLAEAVGFVEVGWEPGAVVKGGKPWDRIVMEVERPYAIVR